MTPYELAAASAVVAVGALVQGSVGFGLNVIAAPVLVMLDTTLIPGPALGAAVVLTALVGWRDRAGLDVRGLGWALVGRVPGSVAGAVAVAMMPERGVAIALAFVVLVAVAVSAGGWHIRPTPKTQAGAGAVSGLFGTVSSIGGPPMALLYQRSQGSALRGTLSPYFVLGASMSIALLAAVGRFGTEELVATGVLVPGVVVGFAISKRTAPLLDRGYTRVAVLVLSSVAAVAAVVSALT